MKDLRTEREWIESVVLVLLIGVLICILLGNSISLQDKINDMLLLAAALLVAYYSFETYALKVVTQKANDLEQKQLDMLSKQNDYLLRPYLRIEYIDDMEDDCFEINNDGTGIAMNVEFENITFAVGDKRGSITFKNRSVIGPKQHQFVSFQEIYDTAMGDEVLPPRNSNKVTVRAFLKEQIGNGFKFTATYKDLEGRNYAAAYESSSSYSGGIKILNQGVHHTMNFNAELKTSGSLQTKKVKARRGLVLFRKFWRARKS